MARRSRRGCRAASGVDDVDSWHGSLDSVESLLLNNLSLASCRNIHVSINDL